MKEKEVMVGSIETMVKIIDWTAINKIISKRVGKNVECRIGNGIIMNVCAIFDKDTQVEENRHIIIDAECIGTTDERRNIFSSDLNEGEPFAIKVFKGIGFFEVFEPNEDGSKRISMFPSYYFDIDKNDVEKCLTGEEKPLFEFMGGRYGYNPRIKNNELGILRLVYHEHIKNKLKDWQKTINKEIRVA